MKLNAVLLALLCYSIHASAQKDSSLTRKDSLLAEKNLNEVVVYANKFAEKRKNLAQKVEVITSRIIAKTNAQNTGDLLINTGNVFVQKSQQGGSSPVIRGFEASRILLVIDGIRMNNAIYRSGHLQNVITIDQNMLDRVEVLYGPASTIYGSDALGGVVHMHTKKPKLSDTTNLLLSHNFFGRYSSANNEKTFHYNGSIGSKKLAWLQSYTFSDFGDLKMGRNYPDKYPDFGRRTHYATTINGIDTILKNEDDRVQKFSGYKQWDITQKILYQPSEKITHLLNLQLSNSTNVPRYDRLQDIRNGNLRYAEWYYGPQKRLLGAYEMNVSHIGFFDEIKAITSYQHLTESRNTREYKRYDRFENRTEKLDVWGFTIDGRKRWKTNEITIGIDGQLNNVKSTAKKTNLLTNTVTPLDTRYPDGRNKMSYLAIYTQHVWKLASNKIIINDGIRLQGVHLLSTINDNSFFNFPFTEIKQNNIAVTGNAGIVFLPENNFRFALNLASGFRAPNIDDLSKIFESSTSQQRIIFPNKDIKPEYTYNIDLSISKRITESISVEVTGFYTWFRNAIITAPFQFNEKDSVLYNGNYSAVFANQNKGKSFLYGLSGDLKIYPAEWLQFASTITYTYGRYREQGNLKLPANHIPPLFGKTSVQATKEKFNIDLYLLFNGWKRIEDYNVNGEDNLQYATSKGMPSWFTLNLKTEYELNRHYKLQVGVENIFDKNYRYFASGFSAPARNFILAIRGEF
ncbi:MAG TPA: TonB-dependent receptor [Chitinophagaceae bacterium]